MASHPPQQQICRKENKKGKRFSNISPQYTRSLQQFCSLKSILNQLYLISTSSWGIFQFFTCFPLSAASFVLSRCPPNKRISYFCNESNSFTLKCSQYSEVLTGDSHIVLPRDQTLKHDVNPLMQTLYFYCFLSGTSLSCHWDTKVAFFD